MTADITHIKNKTALKDGKYSYSYGQLDDFTKSFRDFFGIDRRTLVFILCENTLASAAFFIACIENKTVPLLLNSAMSSEMTERYINIYKPEYIFKPKQTPINIKHTHIKDFMENELVKLDGFTAAEMYGELSFLLPTSGSTGSSKLVRHSYANLYASAKNVSEIFSLNGGEKAMVTLPIYFTQGLSVMCSHLYAGAEVFLTDEALSSRAFWNYMKDEKITSFTGVPYSYEVLDRLRFYKMDLPDLTVISQGGGRMTDELFGKLTSYAAQTGRKFYATYGSSETTARMSCLKPEYSQLKCGSIGKALPNCEIYLIDGEGNLITEPNVQGEIVFKGGNVTLGYAESYKDLIKGDERKGEYKTGDLAYMDEEGFLYIVGRMSRFIKLFGYRVSLDETERLIKSAFGTGFACAGNDKNLYVFTTDKDAVHKDIVLFLKEQLKINSSAFKVVYTEEIPKNQYGKTNYAELNKII